MGFDVKVVYYCILSVAIVMMMSGFARADVAAQLHNQLYPKGYIPPVPVITGTSIPNNSVNVSIDQTILINFSEEITIKGHGLIENTYDFAATEKGFPEGVTLRDWYLIVGGGNNGKYPYSIVYLRDWEPWPAGSTVLIKIHRGAVNVREHDNYVTAADGSIQLGIDFPDIQNQQDYTFRFTTEKGIVPVGVNYTGNSSKNVPLNPTISVVFNRDILPEHDYNNYDLFANITLMPYKSLFNNSISHSKIFPCGSPVPIIKSIEGNTITFRLDNATLMPSTKYEITIPMGSLIAADDSRISLPWALGVDFSTGTADGSRSGTAAGGQDDANASGKAGKQSGTSTSLIVAILSIVAGAALFVRRKKR